MDDPQKSGEIGNQQVTQTDLAWLAGIWDGEGTISIRRHTPLKSGSKEKREIGQYSPRVQMVNTNTAILAKTKSILDALGIGYYFREKGDGGFEGSNRQAWVFQIDTMTAAKNLLSLIRPYLIGKAFQADCLIEFCGRRLAQSDRKGKTNAERAYQPRDFDLVAGIYDANGNQRGTSETVRRDAAKRMIQSELVRDHERGSETALRLYA